jgi:hypothetical protein
MIRIAACSGLLLGLASMFLNPCSVIAQTPEDMEVKEVREQLKAGLTRQRQLQNELDQLRKLLADERQHRDQVLAAMQKKIDSLQATLAKENGVRLAEPIGKVTWVNQKAKTIWINLGRLDKIAREQQLQIRSADLNAKGGEKGVATVTRILDKHLSEARILKQSTENPILPGDQLFQAKEKAKETPTNGEKEKAATAKPPLNLIGSIVAISMDGKRVEVTLGEDDGLRRAMQLDVFRSSEKKYLGRIRILKLSSDRAVAEILPEYKKAEMRKGDQIWTNHYDANGHRVAPRH